MEAQSWEWSVRGGRIGLVLTRATAEVAEWPTMALDTSKPREPAPRTGRLHAAQTSVLELKFRDSSTTWTRRRAASGFRPRSRSGGICSPAWPGPSRIARKVALTDCHTTSPASAVSSAEVSTAKRRRRRRSQRKRKRSIAIPSTVLRILKPRRSSSRSPQRPTTRAASQQTGQAIFFLGVRELGGVVGEGMTWVGPSRVVARNWYAYFVWRS